MSFREIEKNWADVNTPLIMESTCEGAENPERLVQGIAHNYVVVRSLDVNGEPVSATGGTYDVFVELTNGGGFVSAGSIDATKTGGALLVADGEAEFTSFDGNPYRIKVIANGVTGVVQAEVIVNQNVT